MAQTNLTGANIVVLTGAGVSSESGLKTFRDGDGLWEGHDIATVATLGAFNRNPDLVHRFYNLRRRQLFSVQPNRAHYALAEFEQYHKGNFTLITQNVDDLHERAGSPHVIHVHGELRKARCLETGEIFDWDQDMTTATPHPLHKQWTGRLRPHICWFGEVPFHMDLCEAALQKADVFVAIGTSGVVYPVADFVHRVPAGCRTVLINMDEAANSGSFKECRIGPATEIVPEFFR